MYYAQRRDADCPNKIILDLSHIFTAMAWLRLYAICAHNMLLVGVHCDLEESFTEMQEFFLDLAILLE